MTQTRRQPVQSWSRPLVALALLAAGCGGSAGAGAAGPPRTAPPGDADEGKPKGEPPKSLGNASTELDNAQAQFAAASDCVTMCKALGSMRKATEHLCELTKDSGPDETKRCDGAKEKLATAEAKVKATCGGCGP